MNEPPVMISTKDLSYISDIFEWNLVAGKTANHFVNEVEDEEIGNLLENVSNMHGNICKRLVRILEGNYE